MAGPNITSQEISAQALIYFEALKSGRLLEHGRSFFKINFLGGRLFFRNDFW